MLSKNLVEKPGTEVDHFVRLLLLQGVRKVRRRLNKKFSQPNDESREPASKPTSDPSVGHVVKPLFDGLRVLGLEDLREFAVIERWQDEIHPKRKEERSH